MADLQPGDHKPRNELLRQARLRLLSPSGSGRRMSRLELAQLVNEQLAQRGIRHPAVDASYVGKLERGEHRRPQLLYRDAFRTVLGARRDDELGFYVIRREPNESATSMSAVGALVPTMSERRAGTLRLPPLGDPHVR